MQLRKLREIEMGTEREGKRREKEREIKESEKRNGERGEEG